MKTKIKLCRSYQWIKFNTKQITLILIILITVIIYLNKWYYNLKFSNQYSKDIYDEANELNVDTDRIVFQRDFDIVLSYYSEDIDYVAQYIRYLRNVSTLKKLNPRVIIYNKNDRINNAKLKNIIDADIVQLLPNLGREGGTYLYHIINNYHIIANHTIFSQAGVEGLKHDGLADWFFDRLENQFNSSVGYMPLVSDYMITNYDCGSHRTGQFPRMVQLWSMLEQSLCPPGGQAVAFRGQFLVSNKRIQRRSLKTYQYLYDLITANSSHWIHRDIRSIFFKSTPSNPIFGHTIERIWTVLFKCFQPDLYDRCKNHKCACYDDY